MWPTFNNRRLITLTFSNAVFIGIKLADKPFAGKNSMFGGLFKLPDVT
ncbi:hypothetical protein [Mucilaginibacter sp.]